MVTQTRGCISRPARAARASRGRSTKNRAPVRLRRPRSSKNGASTPAAGRRAEKPGRNWPSPSQLRPGSAAEAQLVEQYVPLVKNVVGRLAMTLPPHVDGEELYSAGLSGLLNAVRNYNPRAGTAFETYARLRIRGAVLDELRRMDWVPRSVHSKARKVQAVMNQIEQKKGRPATEVEMAAALKLSEKDYRQWLEEIRPATFVCLDAAFNNGDFDDGFSQYEGLADARQENPVDGTFRREVSQFIAERLKALPDMQRKVLALYYFEDMRLREIAEAFGLTESRICQIHAQAILAIKSHLTKFDPLFA
jgi:RNA polymerase sigma factor for flagellar operon FliA